MLATLLCAGARPTTEDIKALTQLANVKTKEASSGTKQMPLLSFIVGDEGQGQRTLARGLNGGFPVADELWRLLSWRDPMSTNPSRHHSDPCIHGPSTLESIAKQPSAPRRQSGMVRSAETWESRGEVANDGLYTYFLTLIGFMTSWVPANE
jgi:hypothetical protein